MMLRKHLMCLVVLLAFSAAAKSQSVKIDTYANQLLFNIFTDKPDASIKSFMDLYVPSMAGKNAADQKPKGNAIPEVHSFIFSKHPFFNASFALGKLDFLCQRFSESKNVEVYGVKLWFEFSTQQDAEMAYNQFCETCGPISTTHRFSTSNGFMRAEFTDANGKKGFNKIQFRLTADNLDHSKFKILFELENDL